MRRDLAGFDNRHFDLLIIGGGIYGATLAWEATLRGLSVALVERHDFGGGASANSLKIIHGGLRYLQHADIKRFRESVHERAALLRIAPHLVHPLGCIVPTYGHGIKGPEVMRLGLLANDMLGSDLNRTHDRQKRLLRGRVVSREACLELIPGLPAANVTGGALFYDAQVYNSERLTLAFVHSAAEAGAQVANYVSANGLVRDGGRVSGAEVEDRLSGRRFTIKARAVVSTSGPWTGQIRQWLGGRATGPAPYLATAFNIVTRPLFDRLAVGLIGTQAYQDEHALVKKQGRFLFVAPWRGLSMIGTAYIPYRGDPNQFAVREQDLEEFIAEFNQAYPPARLSREDVRFVQAGLVPATSPPDAPGAVQLAKHYQIHHHVRAGAAGFWSVLGIKYTTARDVAEKVVTLIARSQGWPLRPSLSARVPLHGGAIAQFEHFWQTARRRWANEIPEATLRQLLQNYGTQYPNVLGYLNRTQTVYSEAVLRAEVLYAVNEEMACRLSDVVLRRTELGSAGAPSFEELQLCARTMQQALGWDEATTQNELAAVLAIYRGINGSTGNHPTDLAGTALQPFSLETAQTARDRQPAWPG